MGRMTHTRITLGFYIEHAALSTLLTAAFYYACTQFVRENLRFAYYILNEGLGIHSGNDS